MPAAHGLTLAALKARVLRRMRARRLRFKCIFGGAHAEAVAADAAAGVAAGRYARATPLACFGAAAAALRAGDTYTALVFFAPAARAALGWSYGVGATAAGAAPQYVQQHAHFQGLVEWGEAGRGELHCAPRWGSNLRRAASRMVCHSRVRAPYHVGTDHAATQFGSQRGRWKVPCWRTAHHLPPWSI